ncbi:MAG: Ig-like domain repeat protein, partial [Mycobacteriales bacterium]
MSVLRLRRRDSRGAQRRRRQRIALGAVVGVLFAVGRFVATAPSAGAATLVTAPARVAVANPTQGIVTFPTTASGNATPSAVISSTTTPASLDFPHGEAIDPLTGELWVSNYANSSVVAYAPSQLVATANPTPVVDISGAASLLDSPTNLTFDPSGNLWINSSINASGADELLEFTASELAQLSGQVDPKPAAIVTVKGVSALNGYGLAFDHSGNLWVATDTLGAGQLVELAAASLSGLGSGQSTVAPAETITSPGLDFFTTNLNNAEGIAFDSSGDLWVVNNADNQVLEFASTQLTGSGLVVKQAHAVIGGSATGFKGVFGASFDPSGDLWLSDGGADAVFEYTASQLGQLASGTNDVAPADTIEGSNTGLNANPIAVYLPPYSNGVGVPSQLAFVPPLANVSVGQPFTVTVAVEDVTGAVVTGDNSTQVALSGDAVACTAGTAQASSGVATFNCAIDAPGVGDRLVASATLSGNTVRVASNTFTVAKATPSVLVTPSSSPGFTGAITYTVAVTGQPGGPVPTVPSGAQVTVTDGQQTCLIDAARFLDGSGSCSLQERASLSPYQVKAAYPGDVNYLPAAGTTPEVVLAARTATDLTSTTSTVAYGQEGDVTLTATVAGSPGGPAPRGSIDIYATTPGTPPVCSPSLTPGTGGVSSASCTLTGPQLPASTSAYSLVAAYGGDLDYRSSASTLPVALQVTRATPTLSIAKGTVSTPGAVNYVVTVAGVPAGAVPTGTVQVSDISTGAACQFALTASDAGTGSCPISEPAGSFTVSASYSGDAAYRPASGQLPETLGLGTPSIQVQLSAPAVTYGAEGAETLTVSVAGRSASPVPTGQVVLVATGPQGATTLDSSELSSSGSLSFTLHPAQLGAGVYTLQAKYAGDANYAGADSSTQLLPVAPELPAVAVTGPATTPQAGPVTYTVTVSGAGAPPTGTVTVRDGAGGTCSTTMTATDAGVAACAIDEAATAKPTTYQVTASYSGDSNHSPSSSGVLDQVVAPDTYTTTLGLSSATVPYGGEGTLVAMVDVSPTATGARAPDGAVTVETVHSATVLCAAVAVVGGFGSCRLSSAAAEALAPGGHQLTALWLGTGGSAPAPAQTLSVLRATPLLTVAGSPDPAVLVGGATSVTYRITAAALSAAAQPPTGTVAVTATTGTGRQSAVLTCSATLTLADSGMVSCAPLTETVAGAYTVTATYTPDAASSSLYQAATSQPVTDTVAAFRAPGSTGCEPGTSTSSTGSASVTCTNPANGTTTTATGYGQGSFTLSQYPANPTGTTSPATAYFDVQIA